MEWKIWSDYHLLERELIELNKMIIQNEITRNYYEQTKKEILEQINNILLKEKYDK